MITALLMALMMINFADKAVLGLAATNIRAEFGISAEQYGTIASAFFLLFSISALVVGHLADRFSTRKVLFALSLVWSLSMLPVIGSAGFVVILASRIVLGAAEGPAFGVAQHALHKWFVDTERGVPTALLTIATSVGIILAAPGLSWMIIHHGWRSAFILMTVLGLVWSALWFLIGRDGPVGDRKDGRGQHAIREIDGVHVPLWRILVSRTWLGCALSSFAAYWSVALLISWLPPFLTDGLGYSKATTGTLTTLPWIVSSTILLIQGLVTQRLMRKGVSSRWARGVLGGAVVVASGVCTLAFVHTPDGAFKIVLIALGLGLSGAIFAGATTVCGEIAPVGQRGAVLGAFVAVYSLAGVIAPYVAGIFVGQAGSVPLSGYNTVFTITGFLVVTGGVLAMVLIHPERDVLGLVAAGTRTR
ncbi:MFS transporter [Rhodococcus wratislaviensis]|uniref:MFS transporter n=1 Tax=Rhodococcus wratislaviensis TaxID=44752 RepID=UPI00351946E9